MQATSDDCTDLLIGGVEASLWIAEQFATDLRMTFPSLNISTVSTNKLLSVGGDKTDKILDSVLSRKISEKTCVILLSQSGQTFPSLHATRKLSRYVMGNIWILTGCKNSKMEDALRDAFVVFFKIFLEHVLCSYQLRYSIHFFNPIFLGDGYAIHQRSSY